MSEIILLSPARAFMSLKRLKFGSFASTGNSITLAQDAQRICNSLPRAISELKEHMTIVLVDSTQVPHFHRGLDKETLKKHCPELVIRRRVWRKAWDYLKRHSPAFAHITLDERALAALPEDDIPDEALDTVSSSNDTRIENPDLGPGQVADEVEDGAEFDDESIRPIHTSTLRTTPNVMTAGASINASSNTKIVVSTRLGDPLSEFTDSLYFHKCFPTLFFNGVGDFNTRRPNKISLRDWMNHKLRFIDTRFASSPQFIAIVNNMITRHEGISKAKAMIDRRRLNHAVLNAISEVLPSDFVHLDPLSDTLTTGTDVTPTTTRRDGGSQRLVAQALKGVYTVTQHLPGSRSDKHRGRRQVMTLIRENNGVELFHTVSSAEMHWPETQRLIYQRQYISETGRRPPHHKYLFQLPYRERLKNTIMYPVEVVYTYR